MKISYRRDPDVLLSVALGFKGCDFPIPYPVYLVIL